MFIQQPPRNQNMGWVLVRLYVCTQEWVEAKSWGLRLGQSLGFMSFDCIYVVNRRASGGDNTLFLRLALLERVDSLWLLRPLPLLSSAFRGTCHQIQSGRPRPARWPHYHNYDMTSPRPLAADMVTKRWITVFYISLCIFRLIRSDCCLLGCDEM